MENMASPRHLTNALGVKLEMRFSRNNFSRTGAQCTILEKNR